MNCPKCNDPRAEELFEEVDIGVGIQRHTYGAECPVCGVMSCCNHCGAWDFEGVHHFAWCADAKGN